MIERSRNQRALASESTGLYRGQGALTLEEAECVARRVALHLYRGAVEAALAAVRDAWESSAARRRLPSGPELLEEPLASVIEDMRLLLALEDIGVDTVGKLCDASGRDWEELPGFGSLAAKTLRSLAAELRERAART